MASSASTRDASRRVHHDGRPRAHELAVRVSAPLVLGADDRRAAVPCSDRILQRAGLPCDRPQRRSSAASASAGSSSSEASRSTSGGNPPCRWIHRPSAHRYRSTHGFSALVRAIDSPSTRMTAKPIVAAAASATSTRTGSGIATGRAGRAEPRPRRHARAPPPRPRRPATVWRVPDRLRRPRRRRRAAARRVRRRGRHASSSIGPSLPRPRRPERTYSTVSECR